MTTVDPAFADRAPPKGASLDPLFKYVCGGAATMVLITMGGLIIEKLAIGEVARIRQIWLWLHHQ